MVLEIGTFGFRDYIISVFVLHSCQEVAYTERKQLSLVNRQQLNQMSFQQYDTFLQENKMSSNTAQTTMVKNCGKRIQKAVEKYFADKGQADYLNDYAWEFNLVEDKTVNAWCMPGGKVVFYTGIMPICKDETGLAVVMGHEVAHAIANHGQERMSQQMLQNGILTAGALAMSMKENPKTSDQLLLTAVGAGAQVGMLAFSRKHESEADHLGIVFMAMAGYDPREAPKFWERMSAGSGGGSQPQFLSTHPSHDTRISNLNAWIPEAMQYYKN